MYLSSNHEYRQVCANEVATPPRQEVKTKISPMWVYDYTAAIEVTYDTASAIPKTYYYEYYWGGIH